MIEVIAGHLNGLPVVKRATVQDHCIDVDLDIKIGNLPCSLTIDLAEPFPTRLPNIVLNNAADYGILPHVCWQGVVCYQDGEGICVHPSDFKAVVEQALSDAIDVLLNRKHDDFYDEFEGYWNKLAKRSAVSFVGPGDSIEKLTFAEQKKGPCAFLPDSADVKPNDRYAYMRKGFSSYTGLNAYYLPLEEPIVPPLPGQSVDIGILNEIASRLPAHLQQNWQAILQRGSLPKPALYLLVSQPRPSGGRSLFGLKVPFAKHWLKGKQDRTYRHTIVPLAIIHHSPNHMLQRGGARLELATLRIAVVGCGAIGSKIAELLAACGVRDLTLYDGDLYSVDNVYRHVLDSQYVGQTKVEALAAQLQSHFPYLMVTPKTTYVNTYTLQYDQYDVIVDATGAPTLSRAINAQHRSLSLDNKPLLVTAWLEAMGLGGHVVLSTGKTAGCLHCLYYQGAQDQLHNAYAYIEAGQKITKNITGCGGSFTPFNALDATRTAELAVRFLMDSMDDDRTNAGFYRFWQGSDNLAKEERIRVSDWYSTLDKSGERAEITRGCDHCRQEN